MRQLLILFCSYLLLAACGAGFNQPYKTQDARFGEVTNQYSYLKNLPAPNKQIIASVYKFRDQTGQYKSVENGSSFSTVVTQGATSILLKAMEDSGWFLTIERENRSNLLTERQLIRSSQQQFAAENPTATVQPLRPLLYADILLEGGIISYDENIITGGAGIRYFGAGVSTQYREDRVTVYLRAVSTKTGEVLKTVYTSKTILSQALDGNLFRYVKLRRILEAETGFTYNEPSQLAVTEAIEKALHTLIIEGVRDNLWASADSEEDLKVYFENLEQEKEIAENTELLNRHLNRDNRRANSLRPSANLTIVDGDFSGANLKPGATLESDFFLSDYFSIGPSGAIIGMSVDDAFDVNSYIFGARGRFIPLPYDDFTPYLKAGPSFFVPDSELDVDNEFGLTYGAGVEYLLNEMFGMHLDAEQSYFFTDELDGFVGGTQDDFLWNINLGLGIYFTRNKQVPLK